MNPLRRSYLIATNAISRRFMKTYGWYVSCQICKHAPIKINSLTPEQKKQVDEVYIENYGKKISYKMHEMYTSFTGKFDPYYIPRWIYYSDIEAFFNHRVEYARTLEDKNLLPDIIAPLGIRMPKTVWSNSDGINYRSDKGFINENEILELIAGHTELFVKPSIGTSGGTGCKLYQDIKQDSASLRNFVQEILATYKMNFVVQEKLINCDSLRVIHPQSLNTFRIITYILNGKINVAPPAMRFGIGQAHVDNTSAGGLVVGITTDGHLLQTAFTDKLNFKAEVHPDTGYRFAGKCITEFPKVIDAAKRAQASFPQLKLINWDFTIDQNGEPCLIEANCEFAAGYDLVQLGHGKGPFEENTPQILRIAREMRARNVFDREELYQQNIFG